MRVEKDFGRKIKVEFLNGRTSIELLYDLNNKTINVIYNNK